MKLKMSLEIYTFTGGWLDQVGIRLSHLSTQLKLKLKLKMSLAISSNIIYAITKSFEVLANIAKY